MSRLQCRGPIVRAAVVVALLASRPVSAQGLVGQGLVVPGPRQVGSSPNSFSGVQYDIANQAKAERRLQNLRAKLCRDSERGNSAAVGRDERQINYTRYRIAVDEWLIRKNRFQDPGYYPIQTDSLSCAAIAQAASPPQFPPALQSPPAASLPPLVRP